MELQVRISPEEVKERFRSIMAYVKSILFTPTWRLSGDFVGNVQGDKIYMRVRHGYSNGYAPLLFGHVEPTSYGSLIRIDYKPTRLVVVIMTIVWYAILIPTLVYVFKLAHFAFAGGNVDWGYAAAEIAAIFITLAFLYIIEVIAKRLGKKDEEKMRRRVDDLFRDVSMDRPGGIEPR
jgi:hypothetical protein